MSVAFFRMWKDCVCARLKACLNSKMLLPVDSRFPPVYSSGDETVKLVESGAVHHGLTLA